MPFVIREHPHLLGTINGVAFETHPAGSISGEVSEDQIALFLAVPGFRLALEQEVPGYQPPPVTAQAAPVAASTPGEAKPQTGKRVSRKAAAAGQTEAVTAAQPPAVTDAESSGEEPETLF